MIAEVGDKEYVNVNRRAVPAVGPRPGNTPTNMPNVTPTAQYNRFAPASAIEKPSMRYENDSAIFTNYSAPFKNQIG